jgi:hypothetical protein
MYTEMAMNSRQMYRVIRSAAPASSIMPVTLRRMRA